MNKAFKVLAVITTLSLLITGCNKVPTTQQSSTVISSEVSNSNPKEVKPTYTKNFQIVYYSEGHKVITDSVGRDILYLPEGKEAPAELAHLPTVKASITKIGAFQIPIATAISAAGGIDKINLVTYPVDKWTIPEIKSGMEDGKILYVGGEGEPDFEMIKANKPDVIFLNGESHELGGVREKLEELGIVWVSIASHLEEHPLGRIEWQKLVAAFLDTEQHSDNTFKKQEDAYNNLVMSTKDKTHPKVGQFYIMGDSIYVKNGGSYVAKMIEAAGGEYLFKNIAPDKGGNTKMTPEEFFVVVSEADILIYDNASATKIQSMSALLENRDFLKDVKAIKDGKVWGMQAGYNQYIDRTGEITVSLSTAIYDQTMTANEFYKPLV